MAWKILDQNEIGVLFNGPKYGKIISISGETLNLFMMTNVIPNKDHIERLLNLIQTTTSGMMDIFNIPQMANVEIEYWWEPFTDCLYIKFRSDEDWPGLYGIPEGAEYPIETLGYV